MRIGTLASRTGVSERAIRYYDRKELLVSIRDSRGHRHFDESAISRVALIRDLLAVGFGTAGISGVIAHLEQVGTAGSVAAAVDKLCDHRSRLDVEIDMIECMGARLHEIILRVQRDEEPSHGRR